jgi:hypothetical protein
VRIGQINDEAATGVEIDGLVHSTMRLKGSKNDDLNPHSRSDLADGAASRLALAALCYDGYRSENWNTVFQTLVHMLDMERAE